MEGKNVEFVSGLHQLFKHLKPSLSRLDVSGTTVEDVMLGLEETDENFHRYDFVKNLRKTLENSMGSVIDAAVERRDCTNNSMYDNESFVQLVTEEATESKIFTDLITEVCDKSVSAANILVKCFEEERGVNGDDDAESELSKQMRSMLSEEASTSASTFNQGVFFISQGEFHLIAKEMDVKQSTEVRYNALQRLCRVPPSDVMASESWSHLCVSLMDALADNDPQIANKALSFHAKMFAVASHQILRETHTCLTGHLTKCLESPENQLPIIDDAVSLEKPSVKQLIKKYRLLKEFHCEVPSIWVRFPENFIERVVDSTFQLLSSHINTTELNADTLSALDIYSLIDPKATWFRKWLHGNYSRAIVMKTINEKYRDFMVDIVCKSLSYCDRLSPRDTNKTHASHPNEKKKHNRRLVYTRKEISFLHFVQSTSLLAHLLNYSEGRKLFPLHRDDKVITIQQILLSWIKVLRCAKSKPRRDQKSNFEPASLVGKALAILCSCDSFVRSSVDDEVIKSLIQPILNWVEGDGNMLSESTMLHVAEVLSCLASTTSGRKLLLEKHQSSDNSSDHSRPVHVIAEFASMLLTNQLPRQPAGVTVLYPVTGAFVFVCRQIYNACDGLLVLIKYNLHKDITLAWKQASQDCSSSDVVDTDIQSSPTHATSKNFSSWKENLLDNLLNYAATPKGISLLQGTGVMDEAVAYMHSRYKKKLQVSRCEKFGYGVMATQVASTAAGITALSKTGFISAIIKEIWVNLEFASDEVATPRPHSIQPIDRSVQKAFTNLVNIFNSYPSIHEIFCDVPLDNRDCYVIRDIPHKPVDLLDRLIMLNNPSKTHSLLNYEQSHLFGLRLLTALSCSLDAWLLLETQYNIQDELLDAQKRNMSNEGEVIIDQLSIERNHLLVRCNVIGCNQSERHLPARTLTPPVMSHTTGEGNLTSTRAFAWPLFTSLPVPKDYLPNMSAISGTSNSHHGKRDNSLVKFLNKTKSSEKNRSWLNSLQTIFESTVVNQPITSQLLIEVIDKSIAAMERSTEDRIFRKPQGVKVSSYMSSKPSSNLSPVVKSGIKLAVRYGRHVMALKSNVETSCNNLSCVMSACHKLLCDQQAYSPDYKLTSGPYPCHDWFASTLFLMMSGNKDKCFSLLFRFSELLPSGFLWPARLHASIHLHEDVRKSSIAPLYSCTGHNVELILQAELPLVYSAFRMCGYTPSQITQHWLSQCFWNYLNWNQITLYIAVVIVMGVDYQVYICISILRSLQREIFSHRQTQDLQVFLRENSLKDFDIGKWMKYMRELQRKYRVSVLKSMREVTSTCSIHKS